ncbi:MAG: hypothetical protein ABIW76_24500 [Fibrobacteria bacterium]
MGSLFLSLIPWVLLAALSAQAATPGLPAGNPSVPSAPPALATPSGPTVSEFRAAFPGGRVTKVDPVTFNQYVSSHAGQGRLLAGPALAAVVAESSEPGRGTFVNPFSLRAPMYLLTPQPKPKFDPYSRCKDRSGKQQRIKCRDSLKVVVQKKSDSLRVAYYLQPGDSLIVLELLEEELDPPYKPPVPAQFSFKDSIPDLDTNYATPSADMGEAIARRDHRILVRRYYAYRDSVGRDSAAASATAPRAILEMQARDAARKDSLARDSAESRARSQELEDQEEDDQEEGGTDTVVLGVKPEKRTEADHTRAHEYEAEERTGWFVNLFTDMRDGHGDGGWNGDDWAAVIFVVIGVVVVGAFVIYGVQTLAELAINKDGYPIFMEAGLRLSYSGKAYQDPNGNGDLYRDAYLAGLRYAIGFDRPGMGIGIAVEGGYIDVFLKGLDDPAKTFDFKGGYLVAGPMLRFGDNKPWSFSLEFLNGTSNHASIGWISKSRMTLQAKVARHTLVGAHLGAVFYDLHFLDGLGVRAGDFNRDLSLVYGLDTGWEF